MLDTFGLIPFLNEFLQFFVRYCGRFGFVVDGKKVNGDFPSWSLFQPSNNFALQVGDHPRPSAFSLSLTLDRESYFVRIIAQGLPKVWVLGKFIFKALQFI